MFKTSLHVLLLGAIFALPDYLKGSDLKPSPQLVQGVLDNGVPYFIQKNDLPESKLSLRLYVGSGAMDEADDQQGVAHFLEHMLFDGNQLYAPGEMIPALQKMGMSFGRDVNAYTGFNSTVYMLDLPDVSEESLDTGFSILRQYVDGALLVAEEIEKERGVILAEKIARDSISSRLFKQKITALLPESLLPKRFPIGIESVIKGISKERMTDFYQDFYTADNIALIAVGDLDPAKAKSLFEKYFKTLPATKAKRTQDYGKVTAFKEDRFKVLQDNELSDTSLDFTILHPASTKVSSKEKQLNEWKVRLLYQVLNNRFSKLTQEANSPILGGYGYSSTFANHVNYHTISVSTQPKLWKTALTLLVDEFKRLSEYGVTPTELDQAKTEIIKQLEKEQAQESTRKSSSIAIGIVKSIENRSVFLSASQQLELAKEQLATIEPEQCHQKFLEIWTQQGKLLTLATSQKDVKESELIEQYTLAQKKEVKAPVNEKVVPFAYQSLGKSALPEVKNVAEDLSIKGYQLENGISILTRHNPFTKGAVWVNFSFQQGFLSADSKAPALASYATDLAQYSGTKSHTRDELSKILAAHEINYGMSAGPRIIQIEASTSPKSLLTQLQLLSGLIQEPAYRNEIDALLRKNYKNTDKKLNSTSAGALSKISALLNNGDARFKPYFNSHEYDNLTPEIAGAWLTPILQQAPLLVSISGDLEGVDLPEIIATSIGTLPKRKAPVPLAVSAEIPVVKAGLEESFTYESKIDRAHSSVIWNTHVSPLDIEETRTLNLLTKILGNQALEIIREEVGATYSPRVSLDSNKEINRPGLIRSDIICDPAQLAKVQALTIDLGKKIGENGVSSEALEKVIQPLLKNLNEYKKQNHYWIYSVMKPSLLSKDTFDWSRSMESFYKNISVTDVNRLAEKIFKEAPTAIFHIENE